MDQAADLVAAFYDVLNQPSTKNVAGTIMRITHDDWRSFGGESASKDRDAFIAQVVGFGKLIPELAWDVKEVLVAGDRVVVRSEARGTPAGEFLRVAVSGKRFAVMTIDIHTVVDGRLERAYHVEDWAGAVRQLAAK